MPAHNAGKASDKRKIGFRIVLSVFLFLSSVSFSFFGVIARYGSYRIFKSEGTLSCNFFKKHGESLIASSFPKRHSQIDFPRPLIPVFKRFSSHKNVNSHSAHTFGLSVSKIPRREKTAFLKLRNYRGIRNSDYIIFLRGSKFEISDWNLGNPLKN